MNDIIANMLANIKSAQLGNKKNVTVKDTKITRQIALILLRYGFIKSFTYKKDVKELIINLQYLKKKPLIQNLKKISKPGRRIYYNIKDLDKNSSGLGIYILSTSLGIMSDRLARTIKIGGEVLCKIN